MTLFDLTGKVALVTGSTHGIGRAIVDRLAEHGAQVIVSSRNAQECDTVAAELNARRSDCAIAAPASVDSKDEVKHLVETGCDRLGKIDILICNAGAAHPSGPMSAVTDEVFRHLFETNVLGNHWLTQMVAPQMCARKDGAIVYLASVAAFHGTTGLGAYAVSKAADVQLARNMARELGPNGVRVNCLAPALIKTEFSRELWEDPQRAQAAAHNIPLGRLGEPDDIAGAAVFLASRASSWITGQTIIIDGGSLA